MKTAYKPAAPLATAPVTPDSPAFRQLVAEIAALPPDSGRATRGPHDAIDRIRRARFGAFRVPRAEGGGGASLRQFYAALIELAAANADVPHILRAHFWFVEERLRSPDRDVRQRWLDRVVNGEIFSNAMSEPGDSAAVGSWAFQTRLTPDGAGYRLHGTKFYCTGTLFSDWTNVFAVLTNGELASACIPVNRAGVELADDWDGIGQPYTGSGTIRFNHVRVEANEVLRSAVDTAEVAANSKRGDPYLIGQICQLILASIIAGILRSVAADAARLLRDRSRSYSHGVSVRAAQAKVVVDELAQRAASQLFDAGGSSAVRQSAGLDRHWRNIRTLASHNPAPYKARAVGDWLVNATELPNSGFF